MTEHELWEEVRKLQKKVKKLEDYLNIYKDNAQVMMDHIFALEQQLKKGAEEDDDRS